MEAADGMLGGNIAVGPGFFPLSVGHTDERKAQPIGVLERQDGLIEPLFQGIMSYALCKKAMSPKPNGAYRHSERGLLRETDTGTTWSGILPREEGQDCAGVAELVTVVEMISAGVIEVDCLFDEPKPESSGVEVEVASRLPRDGGYVMNT